MAEAFRTAAAKLTYQVDRCSLAHLAVTCQAFTNSSVDCSWPYGGQQSDLLVASADNNLARTSEDNNLGRLGKPRHLVEGMTVGHVEEEKEQLGAVAEEAGVHGMGVINPPVMTGLLLASRIVVELTAAVLGAAVVRSEGKCRSPKLGRSHSCHVCYCLFHGLKHFVIFHLWMIFNI